MWQKPRTFVREFGATLLLVILDWRKMQRMNLERDHEESQEGDPEGRCEEVEFPSRLSPVSRAPPCRCNKSREYDHTELEAEKPGAAQSWLAGGCQDSIGRLS